MARDTKKFKTFQPPMDDFRERFIDDDAPGMEHIRELRRTKKIDDVEVLPPDKRVGVFGIVESNGYEQLIYWKHSGLRLDKPTYRKKSSIKPYSESLLKSMFSGW